MSDWFGDNVQYFYMVTGYTYEPTIEETTDDDGDVTYVTAYHQTPVKRIITETEAIHYAYNSEGYVVYVVYDDDTEELISTEAEEVVGEVDYVPVENTQDTPTEGTSTALKVTTTTITIDSITSGSTLETSTTLTEDGYTLIGAVGYNFSGTSQISIYRMYASGGVLTLCMRNTASCDITDKTVSVTLLWAADGSVTVS